MDPALGGGGDEGDTPMDPQEGGDEENLNDISCVDLAAQQLTPKNDKRQSTSV